MGCMFVFRTVCFLRETSWTLLLQVTYVLLIYAIYYSEYANILDTGAAAICQFAILAAHMCLLLSECEGSKIVELSLERSPNLFLSSSLKIKAQKN